MKDLIQKAVDVVYGQNENNSTPDELAGQETTTAVEFAKRLLPVTNQTSLFDKKQEAKAFSSQVQKINEEINDVADRLQNVIPQIPVIPPLPDVVSSLLSFARTRLSDSNPLISNLLESQELLRELENKKINATRENIKKAADIYTYPLETIEREDWISIEQPKPKSKPVVPDLPLNF